MSSQYYSEAPPAPRTILSARECKHCSQMIYLQYLPAIPGCRVSWIAFDHPDGQLHQCSIKSLDSGTKQMIQNHLEEMNPANFVKTDTSHHTNHNNSSSNNNSIIIEKIDTIIEILNQIKENIISYNKLCI